MTAAFHIEKRLANILEGAVREFIRSGEPVSSERLYDRYDFGIRPARIRSELAELTELGYLRQPHHSAGRIPSDRGYEFFAEQALIQGRGTPSRLRQNPFVGLFQDSAWQDFVGAISDSFGVLGVADDYDERAVYKNGLEDLIAHLDWDSPQDVTEVIRDCEQLEERMAGIEKIMKRKHLEVFVGRKSPVTRSRHLSVVAAEYGDHGKNVMLLAIGPKRMDYEKVIATFKYLNI
jgi:transcriptional regulator of heat shock response